MNIRNSGLWITATALGAMIPFAAAVAADMPVKAVPIVVSAYDWSGVYVGVHAGYGGGMKDWDGRINDFVARGFLAGGQVGINKQISSFVFGLELDGSWANISGSQNIAVGSAALGVLSTQTATSKIDGLLTFAGRAGLAADRWFVFAKGGITMAHERHTQIINVNQFTPPGFSASISTSGDDIRYAPMLGFGAEYALGGNWSIKGEYNYIHMGTTTPTLRGFATQAGVTAPFRTDVGIDEAIHIAKIGVNYRFGGVAKDPSYAPVPAAPGTNWSGAYIGAQAGYGFGQKRWPVLDAAAELSPSPAYDMKGWLGGGTIGANAQAGVFVFGVEGEIMGTGVKGNTVLTVAPVGIVQTQTFDSKIDWLALATARAGFVVGDRLMLYGKGGIAIAQETHNFNLTTVATAGPAAIVAVNGAAKAVHTGMVIGAGAEYALGNNWSVKLEYDYIKMFAQEITAQGSLNFNVPGILVGTGDSAVQARKLTQDLNLVKIGVNYHFSPMPTVVTARY
jgi:opacity protein-like surface antigen